MPRVPHPAPNMVYVCPECDNHDIWKRERANTEYDRDKGYACYACKTGFDEPAEREKRHSGGRQQLHRLPEHIREIVEG